MTHPTSQDGTFCVTAPGIDPGSVPASVTVDYENTDFPEGNASAMDDSNPGQCGSNGRFEVVTERHSAGGDAAAANDVGFTIVIP